MPEDLVPLEVCRAHSGVVADLRHIAKTVDRIDAKLDGLTTLAVAGEAHDVRHDAMAEPNPWYKDVMMSAVSSGGRALVYLAIILPIVGLLLSHPTVAAQAVELIRALPGGGTS